MANAAPRRYSSRVIRAGALLPDTRALLGRWDLEQTEAENLNAIRRGNLIASSSRTRLEAILQIFQQRYMGSLDLLYGLAVLAKANVPAPALERVLYFQTMQVDALLHDVVLDVLRPKLRRGDVEVRPWELAAWVEAQVAAARTVEPWNETTVSRVVRNTLAALRDFGILEGAVNKRVVVPQIPILAFAFIARLRHGWLRSGEALVQDPEWQLFFLPALAVERLFAEAHQEGLLTYQAADPVKRIRFPADSLEAYAHVLVDQSEKRYRTA